ncbi:MAG: tail-specific protease, partial [Proteobacteria bacterium]|nr:tail-specific protease [Pseudomonadota bacterium]
MPRQLPLAFALVVLLVSAPCFGTSAQIVPLDQHERATRLITHFLDKYHYKDFSIDDLLSAQILDAYVGALDPNRSYFHQKDIESFEGFRFDMDDALNHRKLDAPFAM